MNPILMTDIEKIRAEIERLEEIHERNLKKPMERGRIGYAHGVVACCDRILDFLDTLSEEHDKDLSEKIAAAYQLGLANKEEQMLKEAVEGEVSAVILHKRGDQIHHAVTYPEGEGPHSITDKVRIIIVKEDK